MREPLEQYKPAERIELPKTPEAAPKVFQKINCPSCDTEVSADNLNIDKGVAKCGGCHAIFSIEKEVENVKKEPEKVKVKQEYLRPEGIDLFYFNDELNIAMKQNPHWIDITGGFLLPLFAAMFIFFYFIGTKVPGILPIALTIPALYFMYRLFQYHKSKTYIDISNNKITIRHRPNNFKKDQEFDTRDIDQLYLQNDPNGTGKIIINMVINSAAGQKHRRLIAIPHGHLSRAKYLEQEIEKYLGIEDRKVPESNID